MSLTSKTSVLDGLQRAIAPLLANSTYRRFSIFIGLILLWQVYVIVSGVPALLVPSPLQVLQVLFQDLANQKLIEGTLTTLTALLGGMAIGMILGTALAALSITSRWGQDLLSVLTAAFMPLPSIAILPLVMIWFGLTRLSIVLVIAHAATWLIALNIDTGLRTVNPTVLMVGRNLGRSGINLIREIMLPAALPYILTGVRTAWAFGWRTAIAAELVFGVAGSEGGLGWYINNSRYFLQTSSVFAGLVVIAVLGLAVDVLFRLIERRTVEKWGMKQQ
ncbi:MAG: ABC transporter permease [Chroococcidiopsidaceae cyanobacterium CP_BM_ER_R8_30]|nr:ABC transporter permease [Chroococcidiopsidaceae cyanobacterium CP_BM_ER_R8_30]